ncbi:CAMK family protein kinase [Tritrichomonas foetus]|uniref:CAMK family protein kinase n=1 Tax=Tritrichomonas foetus TaxID=1144522 RepID=A0A1J4JPE1_9EUKA|nr:CAMK family protein kinase [Tritrichomonas foetus]|eukprot:OHT01001.1 CAMK family protein kinase [Tritrichomonas foetus]
MNLHKIDLNLSAISQSDICRKMSNPKIEEVTEVLTKHGYVFIGKIGAGAFSTVYLVTSEKYQKDFVVKRTELATSDKNSLQTEKSNFTIDCNDVEIQSLLSLNHPYIIRIYDFFQTDDALYSVLEYCSNGSIQSMIGKGMCRDLFLCYARPVLEALNHCHLKGIAHRDIKPGNILLDDYRRPKLADFGLSFHGKLNESISFFAGSLPFMAPEVVSQNKSDPFKADIWSLGITFYYMVCGRSPWMANTEVSLKKQICGGEIFYPSDINIDIQRFIESLLKFRPDERPTCAEALENFQKLHTSSDKHLLNGFNQITSRGELKQLNIPSLRNPSGPYLTKNTSRPSQSINSFVIPVKKKSVLNRRRKTSFTMCTPSFMEDPVVV